MVGMFKLFGEEGISFYRRGDDAVDGYIVMKNGDDVTERQLSCRREP